jgi:sugar phosphate isomerase/epimerase
MPARGPDRRSVLAALFAVPVASRPTRAQAFAPPGLQLYTVRRLLERDYEGTLARVAALGIRELEFAGLHPSPSAVETVAMLKRHGLSAPSGHAEFETLARDPGAELQKAGELGQRFVVCPSIDEPRRRTLDDWTRIARDFNRVGEQARRAGLVFAYHNHDFEFRPIAGRIPYDLLLAETDPALVKLEMDVYWMARAGRDPLAYFRKYPGRFPLVHLKDMGAGGSIVDVGSGTVDFARLLAEAKLAGIAHAFIEHDDPADPMRSVETSLRYLWRLQ